MSGFPSPVFAGPERVLLLILALLTGAAWNAAGRTVFSDTFSGTTWDAEQWRLDPVGFETGGSTVAPTVGNGVVTFEGTGAAPHWGGVSLATRRTFSASIETNLVFSVTRVSRSGSGTAYRSAIWIADASRTNYVVFSENVGEGGWQYNRRINMPGDVPIGAGIQIPAFDGMEQGGTFRVRMVADGRTVKLFLDDTPGPEILFPFQTNLVFHIGAYARFPLDTVRVQFDDVQVEEVEHVAFSVRSVTVAAGEPPHTVPVRIPEGSNASSAVQVVVQSHDPWVAVPTGADNQGRLSLTFPAGGPSVLPVSIEPRSPGLARFALAALPSLPVASPLEVGVSRWADDFETATVDGTIWQIDPRPFETGSGTFAAALQSGRAVLSGSAAQNYWPGLALMSQSECSAASWNPLVVEVDRVSHDHTGISRSGLWIADATWSHYILFSENRGEGRWQYNRKINQPGDNPTGGGTVMGLYNERFPEGGSVRLRLVADGSFVEFSIHGVPAPKLPFPVREGIRVGFGAYARAGGDTVTAAFDRARIVNASTVDPGSPFSILSMDAGPEGSRVLRWEAHRGFSYIVEYSEELIDWWGVFDGVHEVRTSVPELTWIDRGPPSTPSAPSASAQRFYRVLRVPLQESPF